MGRGVGTCLFVLVRDQGLARRSAGARDGDVLGPVEGEAKVAELGDALGALHDDILCGGKSRRGEKGAAPFASRTGSDCSFARRYVGQLGDCVSSHRGSRPS